MSAGADLKEGFEVVDATFDKAAGLWTVSSASGAKVHGSLASPSHTQRQSEGCQGGCMIMRANGNLEKTQHQRLCNKKI